MARMSREEYLAERERRVEALTEGMADRVGGIATGTEARELIEFMAQFRSRSPRNAMLIYSQWHDRVEATGEEIPRPTMLAGYKQFQAMGRQVRRGEKGYEILAPVTARFASSTPDDASSWRRLASREKPGPGETVQSRMVGVKPASVFDIAQTDGPEIPTLPAWKPLEGDVVPAGLRESVIAEIEREGFTIVDGSASADRRGAEGVTKWDTREVVYDGERGQVEQVTTLLHELGHIKLHSPLGADGDDASAPHRLGRGQKEFEAEAFAHVVAGLHGVDTSEASDAYAAGWTFGTTGGDPSRVAALTVDSAQRVSTAVNATVDRMPIGREISNGALPEQPKETPSAGPKSSPADARIRNALRMEAAAPARIREESPVAVRETHALRGLR